LECGLRTSGAKSKPWLRTSPEEGYVIVAPTLSVHEGHVGATSYPVTTPTKKSLELIGKGIYGQALVKLSNGHPYLDLVEVSSRALGESVGRL
jgi:hypothetical protein